MTFYYNPYEAIHAAHADAREALLRRAGELFMRGTAGDDVAADTVLFPYIEGVGVTPIGAGRVRGKTDSFSYLTVAIQDRSRPEDPKYWISVSGENRKGELQGQEFSLTRPSGMCWHEGMGDGWRPMVGEEYVGLRVWLGRLAFCQSCTQAAVNELAQAGEVRQTYDLEPWHITGRRQRWRTMGALVGRLLRNGLGLFMRGRESDP